MGCRQGRYFKYFFYRGFGAIGSDAMTRAGQVKVNTMQNKYSVMSTLFFGIIAFGLPSGAAAGEHDHMKMGAHDHMEMGGEHDHKHHQAMLDKRGVISRSVAAYTIPDVKLLDTKGAEVSLARLLDGKEPVILNFFFATCTTVCPVTSSTFKEVQVMLGNKRDKVRMVSISIDPENDTPKKLKAYADHYGAGKHWYLLTGSVDSSVAVQRALGVEVADKMRHKPVTFLRPKGKDVSWVRLDGLVSAEDIVDELNQLESR